MKSIVHTVLIALCFVSCRKDGKEILTRLIDVDSNFLGSWFFPSNEDSPGSYKSSFSCDSNSVGHFYETQAGQSDAMSLAGELYIKDDFLVIGDSFGVKINEYPQVLAENDTLTEFHDLFGYFDYLYSSTMILNDRTYYRVE